MIRVEKDRVRQKRSGRCCKYCVLRSNGLRIFLRVGKSRKKKEKENKGKQSSERREEGMCAQQWCKGVGARPYERGRDRERKRRERRLWLSLAKGDRRGYVNGAAG